MRLEELKEELLKRSFSAEELERRALLPSNRHRRESLMLVALLITLEQRRMCLESDEALARWRKDARSIHQRALDFLARIKQVGP